MTASNPTTEKRKPKFSISTVLLAIGIFLLFLSAAHSLLLPPTHHPAITSQVLCAARLMTFRRAFEAYCSGEDARMYPSSDKWCDLLVERAGASKDQFLCCGAVKASDKNLSHYAINPNCEPNSPPDMVIIFETKAGWNQHGGLEILSTKHHQNKGCNILFNDGSVQFVTKDKLHELKWKTEEKRHERE